MGCGNGILGRGRNRRRQCKDDESGLGLYLGRADVARTDRDGTDLRRHGRLGKGGIGQRDGDPGVSGLVLP